MATDARQSTWQRFKSFVYGTETIYTLSRCFEVAGNVPLKNGEGQLWLNRIKDRIDVFEDCLGQLREPKSTDDWLGTRTQCAPLCTKQNATYPAI